MKKLLALFITWRMLILCMALLATFVIPFSELYTAPHRDFFLYHHQYNIESRLPYYVWIWANFDGYHYSFISRNGYGPGDLGFFPLYPTVTGFLGSLVPFSNLLVGLVLANIYFIGALTIILKLLVYDHKKSLKKLFLAIILLYPTSFYYGSVYNDSLFLLLATASLYSARKEKYIVASILGGLATLTRLNGLALLFFIFVEYLTHINERKDLWKLKDLLKVIKKGLHIKNITSSKIYAIGLIPLSFLGYLGFIQYRFGDWNLLFTSMKAWDQDKMVFPLQVVWRYLKILILDGSFGKSDWHALIELIAVFFYVAIIIYSYKKIRFSYWIFLCISLLIPSLTGTFQGMPRYSLHLYPLFLVLTIFLEKRSPLFKVIYFIISLSLLFLFTGLFTRGHFVA